MTRTNWNDRHHYHRPRNSEWFARMLILDCHRTAIKPMNIAFIITIGVSSRLFETPDASANRLSFVIAVKLVCLLYSSALHRFVSPATPIIAGRVASWIDDDNDDDDVQSENGDLVTWSLRMWSLPVEQPNYKLYAPARHESFSSRNAASVMGGGGVRGPRGGWESRSAADRRAVTLALSAAMSVTCTNAQDMGSFVATLRFDKRLETRNRPLTRTPKDDKCRF